MDTLPGWQANPERQVQWVSHSPVMDPMAYASTKATRPYHSRASLSSLSPALLIGIQRQQHQQRQQSNSNNIQE